MRLRLVPENTKWDFFRVAPITFGASIVVFLASIAIYFVVGLNFGIDFRGGTSIRTVSENSVDVAAYRRALEELNLGDVSISQVFDPARPDINVAQVRIEDQGGEEAASAKMIENAEIALKAIDETIVFSSVESVGPKVSGELIVSAMISVLSALAAVCVYVWLRFEWQFAVGAIASLVHDVVITIGLFSLLQIQFDLTIIAALLTIVGYSLNDTVVVFDRVRENLRKFKKLVLSDLLNVSVNETLSRTTMTSFTTLLALFALFYLGGDVIHGFVFAMIWGIVIGTYSSVFVAATILNFLGVKRDWSKADLNKGNRYADIDS
ncbi:protein-export membrane protein SecF [Rhodobacterales bacterium HTCC2150]|nr:protein-export membrane protein SecF [Rhodobacterales bacterium HTCC2150] [Rhodobacteraceae bacterium HTCC2150]